MPASACRSVVLDTRAAARAIRELFARSVASGAAMLSE